MTELIAEPADTSGANPAAGMIRPSVIRDDARGEYRASLLIAAAFFVGFLGWAAWAPLDAGAFAMGQVAVAGNRQSVQHRDGGIVSGLWVKEGDRVTAGQQLLSISAGDVQALERGLTGDYLTLLAERARLVAQARGLASVPAPPEFATLTSEDRPIAAEALRTQDQVLHSQTSSSSAQKGVLSRQSSEIDAKIGGLSAQGAALAEQHRLVALELDGMRKLAAKGYASDNRIREMERELASIDGDMNSRQADIASSKETIGQTRMQAMVIDRDRIEKADAQLRDVNEKLSEVQPKLLAARQQLARALVRAPVSGRVVGLRVFTVGGVVGAGETLMEIVPQDRRLVVQARLAPNDIDNVRRGMRVKVRFPSLHDHSLPDVYGEVGNVSADAINDEKSGQHFFALEVDVPKAELDKLAAAHGAPDTIQAGMPAETLITLRRRSMLDYLFEPVVQAFWRSGHEH